jgi:hypothetical protein
MGGVRVTSAEALERYFRALTARADGEAHPVPCLRLDVIDRDLAQAGI